MNVIITLTMCFVELITDMVYGKIDIPSLFASDFLVEINIV